VPPVDFDRLGQGRSGNTADEGCGHCHPEKSVLEHGFSSCHRENCFTVAATVCMLIVYKLGISTI
jgi:hypothetical protein